MIEEILFEFEFECSIFFILGEFYDGETEGDDRRNEHNASEAQAAEAVQTMETD